MTDALVSRFNASARKTPEKRSNPFSIRLSDVQRQKLEKVAGGKPLGVYMRSLIFGDDGALTPHKVRPVDDPQALAQALGLLGQSRIANNLNQLAKAANTGALPVTPEICRELSQACKDVQELRVLLIKALGGRKAHR